MVRRDLRFTNRLTFSLSRECFPFLRPPSKYGTLQRTHPFLLRRAFLLRASCEWIIAVYRCIDRLTAAHYLPGSDFAIVGDEAGTVHIVNFTKPLSVALYKITIEDAGGYVWSSTPRGRDVMIGRTLFLTLRFLQLWCSGCAAGASDDRTDVADCLC